MKLPESCTKCYSSQELHAHLNGSISLATMEKLLVRYAEKTAGSAIVPELQQMAIAKGDRGTLDQ